MICVPIKEKSVKKVLEALKKIPKDVDLLEFWFDEIQDFDQEKFSKIFTRIGKPWIYKFQSNDKNLTMILLEKPDYIDLDLSTSAKIIKNIREKSPKTEIIISFHDFEKTPSLKKLNAIAKKMLVKKADIVKIAAFAKNFSDALSMLEFLGKLTAKSQKAICISMGKNGEITRIAGHLLGNYLMYAPIETKGKTADGQITFKELKKWHLKSEL